MVPKVGETVFVLVTTNDPDDARARTSFEQIEVKHTRAFRYAYVIRGTKADGKEIVARSSDVFMYPEDAVMEFRQRTDAAKRKAKHMDEDLKAMRKRLG